MLSLPSNLKTKVAAKLLRLLETHKYDVSDGGIHFPSQKLLLRGEYSDAINGVEQGISKNLLTTQGMTYLLGVGIYSTSKLSNWYMALSGANATPLLTWTAANYAANATEITSTTEGYSEATRPAYLPAAPANSVADNYASRAAFTIESATAATITVYGAAVLSSSTRGGTSGVLLSAVKYGTARTFQDGDVYEAGYRVTALNDDD